MCENSKMAFKSIMLGNLKKLIYPPELGFAGINRRFCLAPPVTITK